LKAVNYPALAGGASCINQRRLPKKVLHDVHKR